MLLFVIHVYFHDVSRAKLKLIKVNALSVCVFFDL